MSIARGWIRRGLVWPVLATGVVFILGVAVSLHVSGGIAVAQVGPSGCVDAPGVPCRSEPEPERPRRERPRGSFVLPPTPGPSPHQLKMQKLVRDSTTANDKGVEYYNRRDYDTALEYFEKALRINPNNLVAINNKANALNQKGVEYDSRGDYETAIEYFKEAGLLWLGTNPTILGNLRLAEERLQNVRATALRMEKMEQDRREEEQRKRQKKVKTDRMLGDLKEVKSVPSGDQLKGVVQTGKWAVSAKTDEEASAQARRGFDTSGVKAGSLHILKDLGRNPWKAPVVTDEDRRRVPEIKEYEGMRSAARERRVKYQAKLEKLKSLPESEKPRDWSVQVAEVEQKTSNAGNEEIYYNFQIGEALRKSNIPK